MRDIRAGRSSWWWLGVLLALPTAEACAPSMAHAGCGDYVHIGGPALASPPAKKASRPQPATPIPCNGPSCGRNTPQPLAPMPIPVRLAAEQWVCLALALAAPTASPSACRAPALRAGPSDPTNDIFHPPRS